MLKIYIKKEELKVDYRLIMILSLLLIAQSLSILWSKNVVEFLKIYKNIILGIIYFLASNQALNSKKRFKVAFYYIVLVIFINLFYKIIYFFRIEYLYGFLENVIYDNFIHFLDIQRDRSRFFIELYDWALISILVYFSYKQKKVLIKLLLITIAFSLIFFSVISGYRALFLISMAGIIFTPLILNFRKIFFFTILIFLFLSILFSQKVSLNLLGTSSISRLSNDELNKVSTTNSRLMFWQEAWNMGISSPLFGIGLGNFYDNLPYKKIATGSLFDPTNEIMKVTAANPHNYFFASLAETGFFGLISSLILIGYFFVSDIKDFWINNFNKSLVLSFWLLFCLSLIEPSFVLQYNVLFWLLRSAIYKNREILFS